MRSSSRSLTRNISNILIIGQLYSTKASLVNLNTIKKYAFPKTEKLTSKKAIDSLFLQGKSVHQSPLRALYQFDQPNEQGYSPVKILFVVPKRRFKRAVDRNKIRRHLRESYRQNKHELCLRLSRSSKQLNVAILYMSNESMKFEKINEALKELLNSLLKKISGKINE